MLTTRDIEQFLMAGRKFCGIHSATSMTSLGYRARFSVRTSKQKKRFSIAFTRPFHPVLLSPTTHTVLPTLACAFYRKNKLHFSNMSYSVPHPSGDGQLELLTNISGFCKPGQVCWQSMHCHTSSARLFVRLIDLDVAIVLFSFSLAGEDRLSVGIAHSCSSSGSSSPRYLFFCFSQVLTTYLRCW